MNTVDNRQILVFAAANILLIIVAAVFWLLPMMRDINHLRSHVQLQESQYAARARHHAAYADNLRELEMLYAKPRLMTYDERAAALREVNQVVARNSLHRLGFSANRAAGFYSHRLGQVDTLRINAESEVTDVLRFLYALENTPAHILSLGIDWDEYPLATINVDMSLVSVGE